VINIDNLTREDIGRHRIAEPRYREIIRRKTVVKRAPEVRHVERLSKREVPVVKVREQSIRIRSRTAPAQVESGRTGKNKVIKMVLPKNEKRKVEKHTSRVEREVLARRKVSPAPSKISREKKDAAPKRRDR
jgi:hypothetical protein